MATACGSWRRAWQRVGKAEVDMEVEAEVVEENEEEKEKEEEEKKSNSDKSNNPHLAGGEKSGSVNLRLCQRTHRLRESRCPTENL